MMQYYSIGIDEVGRGALAGPVVAAAFAVPRPTLSISIPVKPYPKPDCWEEVRDSKKLSRKKIAALAPQLCGAAGCYFGVGLATAHEIDRLGIVAATGAAMNRAVEACCAKMSHESAISPISVDGDSRFGHREWRAIPHGDATIKVISAASIIAKFYRDCFMQGAAHRREPEYGFDKHVGYGTAAHRHAIEMGGPGREHRLSFHCPLCPPGRGPCPVVMDCVSPGCWNVARARQQRKSVIFNELEEVAEQTQQMLQCIQADAGSQVQT